MRDADEASVFQCNFNNCLVLARNTSHPYEIKPTLDPTALGGEPAFLGGQINGAALMAQAEASNRISFENPIFGLSLGLGGQRVSGTANISARADTSYSAALSTLYDISFRGAQISWYNFHRYILSLGVLSTWKPIRLTLSTCMPSVSK